MLLDESRVSAYFASEAYEDAEILFAEVAHRETIDGFEILVYRIRPDHFEYQFRKDGLVWDSIDCDNGIHSQRSQNYQDAKNAARASFAESKDLGELDTLLVDSETSLYPTYWDAARSNAFCEVR